MTPRIYVLAPFLGVACAAAKPSGGPRSTQATPSSAIAQIPSPPLRSRPPPTDQTLRLARAGTIWGRVRYLHPYLFDRVIDWDAALVRALPMVLAATNEDEEASAVSDMLGELHDPLTHVETRREQIPSSGRARPPSAVRVEDGITIVELGSRDAPGSDAERKLRQHVASAGALVLDLRSEGGLAPPVESLDALADVLVSKNIAAGTKRWISHEGFVTQRGTPGGGYRTTFVSEVPRVFTAAPGPHPKRVAFIVDKAVGIPDLPAAMQRAGRAVVVADGPLDDPAERDAFALPLGERHVAVVRATEVEPRIADVELDDHGAATPLETAIAVLRRPPPVARPSDPMAPLPARIFRDDVYAEENCPPMEHRLLGLFRFFAAIDLFYPYKALLDQPWKNALEDFIPIFMKADTRRDYELAIRELSARLDDSHVWVAGGEALFDELGHGHLPFHVRRIENRTVVVSIAEPARGARSSISIGDIVLEVGGEGFTDRARRIEKYVAGSTPDALANAVDDHALRCAKGDIAVRLAGADNQAKNLRVPCVPWFPPPTRSGPKVRVLGNVGYVDLERLEKGEVDAMFDTLAGTRGIIFDMRGYPNGTAGLLARHLETDPAPRVAALSATNLVSPLSLDGSSRIVSAETLYRDAAAKHYTGKTVMLIDDRTLSAAEHTGLYLEAANGTTFIGSRSAGANGYTTWVCLPGDLCVTFSGEEIRHGDGRQLQRVGLVPDVPVTPTLGGAREGRDEVLERAVEYLNLGR